MVVQGERWFLFLSSFRCHGTLFRLSRTSNPSIKSSREIRPIYFGFNHISMKELNVYRVTDDGDGKILTISYFKWYQT